MSNINELEQLSFAYYKSGDYHGIKCLDVDLWVEEHKQNYNLQQLCRLFARYLYVKMKSNTRCYESERRQMAIEPIIKMKFKILAGIPVSEVNTENEGICQGYFSDLIFAAIQKYLK